MKLKNKQTGEIVEITMPITNGDGWNIKASSLAELCEEWSDYEEPKELYFVDARQDDCIGILNTEENPKWCARLIELGLGFETEQEAEKAVEKLKAWKRLSSLSFKFKGWRTADLGADKYYFVMTAESDGAGKGDLDLLFGGEE